MLERDWSGMELNPGSKGRSAAGPLTHCSYQRSWLNKSTLSSREQWSDEAMLSCRMIKPKPDWTTRNLSLYI